MEFSQKILMAEPKYVIYMIAENLRTIRHNVDGTVASEFVIRIPIQLAAYSDTVRAIPFLQYDIMVPPKNIRIDEYGYFAYLTYEITTSPKDKFNASGRIYYDTGSVIAHLDPFNKFAIVQIKENASPFQKFFYRYEEEGWDVQGFWDNRVWSIVGMTKYGTMDMDCDPRCNPIERSYQTMCPTSIMETWKCVLNSNPPVPYRHLFYPANLDYTLKNGFTLEDGNIILKKGFADYVVSMDEIDRDFISNNFYRGDHNKRRRL